MKKILITGASRGIGRAIAKAFVSEGNHEIVIVSRNLKALRETAAQCGTINPEAKVTLLEYDITNLEKRETIASFVRETLGQIDILISNAGALVNKRLEDLTPDDFGYLFGVNVKGLFFLIQAMLPMMREGSHIVNIGSVGGIQGSQKFPGLSLYSAGKGAVAILSEAMAEELKDRKISVNCLALGAVQTEMLAEAFPGYKAPVTPEEMGRFIAGFALEGNQVMNGKIIPVSLSTP
ncbi:MAG: SDR family oxidoreductase [Bacteroidales bacterium]